MKNTFLFSFALFCFFSLNLKSADNKTTNRVKFLTLSNGNYKEFYNNDSIVQISTALLNTFTNKVVGFVADDTTEFVSSSDNSSRWTSIDPLAQKYYQISPYVYVADNPMKYIDPDGKVIVLAGTPAQREIARQNLQKLTNDRIMVSPKTGIVYIQKYDGANGDKKLSEGTSLVRTLNAKGAGAKTVTIELTEGANGTKPKSQEALLVKDDGSKGKGSDATVYFNPDKKDGGVNVNGSNERPVEIGLGHELEHAENVVKGQRDDSSSGVKDPDGSGETLTKSEIQVRKDENKLRQEQGIPLRKVE